MNNRYRKGYRFEHRVKKYLEKKGYKVFRIAGSKPIDLIAMSSRIVYLVECKGHREKLHKASERILEISGETCAKPIIAYRKKDNKIGFIDVKENKKVEDIPDAVNINEYMGENYDDTR